MIETLTGWDDSLLLFFNGMHNEFFDAVMYAITGKWIWVPFYVALAVVMFVKMGWRKTLVALVAVALIITLADQICSSLIRPAVGRYRPSNVNNPINPLVHLVNNYHGGKYGFPSCHAANTMGLAVFISLLARRRWVTVGMVAWSLVVSYSRIYLGVHYPGDVLVGFIVGGTVAYGVFLLYRYVAGKI